MDNINILNIIIFTVIIMYVLNIFVKKYKYSETFQLTEDVPLGYDSIDDRNIDVVNNDVNLFGEFCKKLQTLDSDGVLSRQFKNELEVDKLKLKQKKARIERLLEQIFSLQQKIYNNDDEVKKINKYRSNTNEQLKEKIKIINKAYDNVKNTLLDKIHINVNLEK